MSVSVVTALSVSVGRFRHSFVGIGVRGRFRHSCVGIGAGEPFALRSDLVDRRTGAPVVVVESRSHDTNDPEDTQFLDGALGCALGLAVQAVLDVFPAHRGAPRVCMTLLGNGDQRQEAALRQALCLHRFPGRNNLAH
jgi:hypothetical protein